MALIMHTLFLNLPGQTTLLACSAAVTTSLIKGVVPLREAPAKQEFSRGIWVILASYKITFKLKKTWK